MNWKVTKLANRVKVTNGNRVYWFYRNGLGVLVIYRNKIISISYQLSPSILREVRSLLWN
jgi:hypothetical protein